MKFEPHKSELQVHITRALGPHAVDSDEADLKYRRSLHAIRLHFVRHKANSGLAGAVGGAEIAGYAHVHTG
jgi:hypothetical protein